MNLRDYQTQCIDQITEAFTTSKSALVCMPTGTGKTIVFGSLIDQYCKHDKRALVVAHTDELIGQAYRKITQITGEEPEIEKADSYADQAHVHRLNGEKARVVVTSIQTQNAGKKADRRMTRLNPEEFSLVVIDEAHHAVAASYKRLIEYYQVVNPDVKILGVTATPDRHDEQALGQVFETVAYDMEILSAIDSGWLVPIRQRFIEITDLDFSGITKRGGDFAPGELEAIMKEEKKLQGVADATVELAAGRRTLVFASGLAHAERLCEIINRHEPGEAIWVHGKTPIEERRHLVKGFREGRYTYMINVQVATEGFDVPGIELIAVARPTCSRALYCQMVGRGTRPADDIVPELNAWQWNSWRRTTIEYSSKPYLEVLDFIGQSGKHKLIHVGDILAGDYDDVVVARAKANAKTKQDQDGLSTDMLAELKAAEQQLAEEHRTRRRSVVGKARWKSRNIDPFDVLDVSRKREKGWHRGRPATARQRAVLVKAGVDRAQALSFSECSQIIDQIIRRSQEGLCTYKQARLLAQFGYDENVSFEEAGDIITKLKANNWKALP